VALLDRSVVAGIARQEHAPPVPLDDDARKNGRHLAPLQSLERGGGRGGAVEELQVLHRRITQRQLAPSARIERLARGDAPPPPGQAPIESKPVSPDMSTSLTFVIDPVTQVATPKQNPTENPN